MEESEVGQQLFSWQQARRKPESGGFPIGGFGPGGQYTLWLPKAEPSTRIVIRDGEPVEIEVPSVLDSPEILAMRERILLRLRDIGPGMLSVPIDLMRYAAALIRLNYNMRDAELTMLLTSDPEMPWAEAIFKHAMGGEQVVVALAAGGEVVDLLMEQARARARVRDAIEDAGASAESNQTPNAPPAKRGWLRRLIGW